MPDSAVPRPAADGQSAGAAGSRGSARVAAAVAALARRLGSSPEHAANHLDRLAERYDVDLGEAAAAVLATADAAEPADVRRPGPSAPTVSQAPPASPAPPAVGPAPTAPVDPDPLADLAREISSRLGPLAGVDAVAIYAAEPDGSLQMVGSQGLPPAVIDAWRRVSPQLTTAAGGTARSGRPMWLPRLDEARRQYVMIGDPDVEWRSRAMLPVPDGPGEDRPVVAVVAVFCTETQPFEPATRRAVLGVVGDLAGPIAERLRTHPHPAGWIVDAQAILDVLPGAVVVSVPIRDAEGGIIDWIVVAASPEAVDIAGRRGRELVGTSTVAAYPSVVDTELWHTYAYALRSGRPREIGPFVYSERADGVDAEAVYTVRASRFGGGLMIIWVRHDEQRRFADRLAQTERMGKLGWGEWDLLADRTYWSEGMYAIFERDHSRGPATLDEARRHVHPDDAARLDAALEALLTGGEPIDLSLRLVVPDRVKHVRGRFEATRDRAGRVLKVYGLVLDVSESEAATRDRARLADIEAELAERQRSQQVEHRLVRSLQRIILPLPSGVLDLPGLDVAVRYQPAEEVSRVGGDWFDVVRLPGGRTLLAVGDVAGHGIAAAATMARLRHSFAALAVTSAEPAKLLAYLNRMVSDDATEPTATVVVAHYDPQTREVTWAQAGHPPPILMTAEGTTALARPSGMIVGARADSAYETARVTLRPGDTMLLYTDGLIERRGSDGSDWLGPALRALDGAAGVALDELLARLRPANPGDDTCVLALRPRA
ncbi:MAG TPA: SpoIIE family protein phosphatase [Asanoa sp.]